MTAGLIDLIVRSSLLLALVWCAAAMVRRAGGSAAMRHMVWLLGLGALFLFPLLSALMPPLPLAILPAVAVPAAAGIPGAAPMASTGLGDLVRIVYLAVAAGLLGRLALGQYLLMRLWKRARPVGDARWLMLLDELREALAIRRLVALRLAPGPAMPMTWGSWRPRVLLPAEALAWTDERRRIVLLHELAHVARRDSVARAAAAVACALYWFHPLIWHAAWRMRLEQEHACDDLVLSLGATASAYARNLLDIAVAFRPPPIVASLSVAMARTSELERRLRAIVARGPRRRSSPRFVASSGAAAMATTLAIATVAPIAALAPAPPAQASVIVVAPSVAEIRPIVAERHDRPRHRDLPGQRADTSPPPIPPIPPVPAIPPIPPTPPTPATPPTPPTPSTPSTPATPPPQGP